MRISDWSSDVCSSDLTEALLQLVLYYTSVGAYVTAFELAQQAQQFLASLSAEDQASVDRLSLAQLQDVVATYLHLNNDLVTAGEIGRASCRERVCPYV